MKILPLLSVVALALNVASADVTLPPIISDNMLLQQPRGARSPSGMPGRTTPR